MFQLHDLKESKVWQEAHQTGREEGREEERRTMVRNCLAAGMPVKKIAELTGLTLKEVRRLAKDAAR